MTASTTSPLTADLTDDEILSLWHTVSPSYDQNKEMTYQSGPYDVECPTWKLRRLVELSVGHGYRLAMEAAISAVSKQSSVEQDHKPATKDPS